MLERFILEVEAFSHKGHVKSENQDRVLAKIGETQAGDFGLFAVADGISGLEGSGQASDYMVHWLNDYWYQELPFALENRIPLPQMVEHLEMKLLEINQQLNRQTKQRQGTTLTVLLVYGGEKGFVHLGDTRIYQYQETGLKLLTEDHTYVADLLEQGVISAEEVKKHPKRHVLTQCIGASTTIHPQIYYETIQEEELYMICSDGLYDALDEKEILITMKQVKEEELTLKEGIKKLTIDVLRGQARDNLSCILLKIKKELR